MPLLSVRLDAKTEHLVDRLARTRGQTKSEVIREAIAMFAQREGGGKGPRRPYELIAHLIGCADSGGAKLSERTGEKFAALLRERARGRRSR